MASNLMEIISGVINVPTADLSADSGPTNQANWDSLAHITLVAAVEQSFGVQLSMTEILGIKTIADLEAALLKHGVPPEKL